MVRQTRKNGGGVFNTLRGLVGSRPSPRETTTLTYDFSDVDTLLASIGDQIVNYENPYTNVTRISIRNQATELVNKSLIEIYSTDKSLHDKTLLGTKLARLIIKMKGLEQKKGKSAEPESFTNKFTAQKLSDTGYPDFSNLLEIEESNPINAIASVATTTSSSVITSNKEPKLAFRPEGARPPRGLLVGGKRSRRVRNTQRSRKTKK